MPPMPELSEGLVMIGLNHQKSGQQLVEEVRFPDLATLYRIIKRIPTIKEAVVIQTCHRLEIYMLTTNKKGAIEAIKSVLESRRGKSIPDDKFVILYYLDAVRHLFRLASGLESPIIGEPEILKQIKEAYDVAVKNESVGTGLKTLFERAIRVGKRVRTETDIAKGVMGSPTGAVKLIERDLGTLKGKKILIVGAGQAGRTAARYAKERGAEVLITNRTFERAKRVAEEIGGVAIPFNEFKRYLKNVDGVILAVEAPEPILKGEEVKGSKAIFVDLSVPSALADPPKDIKYYTLVQVERFVTESKKGRMLEASRAEKIIEEEINKFIEFTRAKYGDKLIKEIMKRAEKIKEEEVKKALNYMDGKPSEEVLNKMASSIVKKILKDVIKTVREASRKGDLSTLEIIAKAFNVEVSNGELKGAPFNVNRGDRDARGRRDQEGR